MRGTARTIGVWILLGLTFVFVWNMFNMHGKPVAELKYNEFDGQLASGNIRSIVIDSDGVLSGELIQPVQNAKKFRCIISPTLIPDVARQIRGKNAFIDIEFRIASPGGMMAFFLALLPFVLLFLIFGFIIRKASGGAGSGMMGSGGIGFLKSKAKLTTPDQAKLTFMDVAGVDEAKEELKEVVDFLKNPQRFTKMGAKIPKGVLLMGPAGCGKTLLARAVAGEAGVPFFSVSGSDFVEMYVGVGAGRVRDMFATAKKQAPCIIFVDELDAMGRQRGAGMGGGNDEREQTLNQILIEMDGFDVNQGIILLAATNRPDILDPALVRPGRFDRKVVVNAPDLKGREEILRVHAKTKPIGNDVDFSKLARGTPGFTGADLANLLNEAALEASKKDRPEITDQDVEYAKDKVLMGPARRAAVMTDQDRKMTAYHEAGHALVAVLLKGDPVHKVTIVPRGMSLGSTWQLPLNDKFTYSAEYLEIRLAICMGGRAAEELEFSQFTTGASNDIAQATEIARRMVCEWGMTEELGPVKFESDMENPFLGKRFAGVDKSFSEETYRKIDGQIFRLLTLAYEQARGTITAHRNELREIAEKLLEKETLSGDELQDIIFM